MYGWVVCCCAGMGEGGWLGYYGRGQVVRFREKDGGAGGKGDGRELEHKLDSLLSPE